MVRKLFLCFVLGCLLPVCIAQTFPLTGIDSLVSGAISQSEKALFEANFLEAEEKVNLSYFEDIDGFHKGHEILLATQEIRVTGFMNVINGSTTDHKGNFKRLKGLMRDAKKSMGEEALGDVYLTFSRICRSHGKGNIATVYESKARSIYEEAGDLGKMANLRANNISWKQYQLEKKGKIQELLALIPKYEKEITFSTLHNKYATSYNTRHLAQIHLKHSGNYEKAMVLFRESLDLREEIGFKPFIPASYASMGDVYAKLHDHELALEMYLKSAETAKEIGFKRYQTYPYLGIGDCFLNQDPPMIEMAEKYYQRALDIAWENHYSVGITQATEKISSLDVYKRRYRYERQ